MNNKTIYIVGGGTIRHVGNHLALAAPAYGSTARHLEHMISSLDIYSIRRNYDDPQGMMKYDIDTILTSMAGGDPEISTPEDLVEVAQQIADDPDAKIVFWTPAVVDFELHLEDPMMDYGRNGTRLRSSQQYQATLRPSGQKALRLLRATPNSSGVIRKDLTVVGFKATSGATAEEQYKQGLALLKTNSLNLVFANDAQTKRCMVITPEESVYYETVKDRGQTLAGLINMVGYRSQLTFTRSTVVDGSPVEWTDPRIPGNLRTCVEHCIQHNAYKAFMGATVGHFAVKLGPREFLTSIRKTNFNQISSIGMVRVVTDGEDSVYAYGAKPSVGGQSQRMVFTQHPDMDCILHFHSPLKPNHPDDIPVVSQMEVECGSHQCGQNTASGLKAFGNIRCVMLDNHGPNLVFSRNTPAAEIIDFIERNFDLSKKTGGYIPA